MATGGWGRLWQHGRVKVERFHAVAAGEPFFCWEDEDDEERLADEEIEEKPRFRRYDPKSGLSNYITDILFKPRLHDFSKLGFDFGSFILYCLLALISEDIGDFRIRLLLQNELDDFVVFTFQLLDCLMESFVD